MNLLIFWVDCQRTKIRRRIRLRLGEVGAVAACSDAQGRRKHFRIGMAKIIPCHGPTMEGPKVPSEAREARSAGAPRAVGPGEGRRSPSPVWGLWGLCPQKIFQKINVEIAHFQPFLQAKIKWSHLQCRQGTYD